MGPDSGTAISGEGEQLPRLSISICHTTLLSNPVGWTRPKGKKGGKHRLFLLATPGAKRVQLSVALEDLLVDSDLHRICTMATPFLTRPSNHPTSSSLRDASQRDRFFGATDRHWTMLKRSGCICSMD